MSKRSRVRVSYATAIISMTLVLFLLGAAGFIMTKIYSGIEDKREEVPMIVEIKNNISETERDAIAEMLDESDMIREVVFEGKDELLEDDKFQEAFGIDIEELLGENPLFDHYKATLSSMSADGEALEEFAEQLRAVEGVEHVSYPEQVVEALHPMLDTTQLVIFIVGAALLLISFILLSNTVLLDVYSQRELINTLKAVGATKWFIMRPFIRHSILQGILAGILASALLVGAIYGLDKIVAAEALNLDMTAEEFSIFPTWIEVGIGAGVLTLLGVIVAVICTLPIVNHFLNMRSNKIQIC